MSLSGFEQYQISRINDVRNTILKNVYTNNHNKTYKVNARENW